MMVCMTKRIAVAYPRELAQAGEHFASGVNNPGEARGLALSGRHFGIALSDLRTGLIDELEMYTHGMQRLRGAAVKENALISTGFAELDAERLQAFDAGWFDAELYDSADEARADWERIKAEDVAATWAVAS